MPPKAKKGGGKDSKAGEEKREEPLQAVIFADSFETRFHPFTLEGPRCLLPLANTPLLEYTLEYLAGAGVEEVFLYCGNFTDQVEHYLQASKWLRDATAPFSLEIIRSSSRSIGDCMRDLHQKELIVGDFICVYGDIVANVPLDAALAAHRARVEKDKKAIMTMVLREAGPRHRTQSRGRRPCFVLDATTGRCVHYEQLRPGASATLDIPAEALEGLVELEVREDLLDCGLDICTPEVLAQYTDNFDWQRPRRGFLYGVLKDYETFQLTIHAFVVTDGYAARVKSLAAYDAISRDVVSRWAYPICPEMNLVEGQTYQCGRRNVYQERDVRLARTCDVVRNSVVGEGTSIGEHTTITNSVIGRRCIIGDRVTIDGAYIWDDARVGDGTTVHAAIVANEADVGQNSTIERGALLAYKVCIADGITIAENQRITTLKRKRGHESDEVTRAPADAKIVGERGEGFHMELDEDEEDPLDALMHQVKHLDLPFDETCISQFDSDEEQASEDDDYEDHNISASKTAAHGARSDSFTSVASDESGNAARQGAADFHHEAVASVFDALQKQEDPDTVQLELRALTLSSNAEGKQVRRALAVAFTKRVAHLMEGGGRGDSDPAAPGPKDAVARVFPANQLLIRANVKDEGEQAEFLLFLQTDLVHRVAGEKVLLFAANELATRDLVEAEGFEAWWNDPRSAASEELLRVRRETKPLVDVLVGDDSEEDEDEEDEEDDDDDDD